MNESDLEIAAARADRERAARIAVARDAVSAPGSAECEDCGAVIETARRFAMTSATRCIDCQRRFERQGGI